MNRDAILFRLVIAMTLLIAINLRADDFFESKVRPILIEHCLQCHGSEKQKAGLRLDSKQGWKAGGENGPSIIPGKPEESLLVKAIRHRDENLKMPPNKKLLDRDIAILVEWIKNGAVDPRDGGPARLGGMTIDEARKWWSFQPLKRPSVPNSTTSNPIDAFILEKLKSKNLAFSSTADKRTLIRRATYDLLGLPPTPQEVDYFLEDQSPDAFAKVIDRLLASPHYGERWGRHWLDLVRYADTAGENSDHPLPHAWRYRNWVIDAINRDQPFDEFIRDQIAGDILAKHAPAEKYGSKVVATGYLAIARRFGHDIDKDIHLTFEDTIDTLGKTLLGLTLGCARCHDHKYDPVTMKDYYSLYGILESTRFAFPGCEPSQQPRDLVPMISQSEWDRTVKPFQEKLKKAEDELKKTTDERTKIAKAIRDGAAKSRRLIAKGEIPDGGEQVFELANKKPVETIDVKPGELIQLSISPLKNYGADTTQIELEIVEVGGQSRRWTLSKDITDDLLRSNPHADHFGNPSTWWFIDPRDGLGLLSEKVRDHSGKAGLNIWRNGDNPALFVNGTSQPISVWTNLPAKSVFVHPAPNGSVAVGWMSPIAGKIAIRGRVADAHKGGPDGVGWSIEHLSTDLRTEVSKLTEIEAKRTELSRTVAELNDKKPKPDMAYAVTEGIARNAKLHLRGDPEKPGPEVQRRWLEMMNASEVPKDAGSGRLQLAQWLTDSKNPLTARVMANRIWQHHFGKGIVKTPNDFGSRGQLPTHPELLDWLASEFVASGWSLKKIHRQILLSQTWQQTSSVNRDSLDRDANNDLYSRFDRRRLSAEEIRDSLLTYSGQLDRNPGGPHPFPPESSWGFTQHNPFSTHYESDKRSVYLAILRNRRHPFLGLFDGADPNTSTPVRQVTTVPTQALYFLNDPFFHGQSNRIATNLMTLETDRERLTRFFSDVLQRTPSEKEITGAIGFLKTYSEQLGDIAIKDRPVRSWAALARVLLADNETLYLD